MDSELRNVNATETFAKCSDPSASGSSSGVGTVSREQQRQDDILNESKLKERLVGTENRVIWLWKTVVVIFILVTAAGVIAGTYYVLESSENLEFEDAVGVVASGWSNVV
jgi:hypothetical protein